ncbi:transporter substrate-binding domain-containing protein [Pseudomonas fluorescens]|jgi:polar amino acid transport system substrate-binding protein|uniref:Amino acid ABC transporter substrate-binding protein n=1 Tax=Pseudomonas aylmerensis TaxID=1869229 RepID=A0A2T4GBA1_9PSED|nr:MULTISPECIES: transporter substrate-binding domain-containing protein [Pseudomonas]AYF50290.1 amino acid ABC transporter substrate-binding protein [Pseudomonas fluorescens]MBK5478710.1 transporter substrate-binding domain-containing protein [Pseudomonas sp. TH21]MBS7846045.1 transporter substrate-binding domain-containing protein [Pseudomonas fluorescens]OCW19848.1 amino acid ABC transporter substrate-binding protein [Pseudomonas aylmerensis]PTC32964.1 amino acid ABC transporter substrate-b
MRVVLGALWMIASASLAAPAPLRFSVSDSWAMPMVQLEDGRPTQGILYDLMLSLATQVGRPAQFHVLARARISAAMEHGEIDVRCYVTQAWFDNLSGDYTWSIPLMVQRNLLVSTQVPAQPVHVKQLPAQSIGTVLNYRYATLDPLFASGQLTRDDARSEEQVLHKLVAGRFKFAVINEWILDRFNQRMPIGQKLHKVAVIDEQNLGCTVRNDPDVPVQRILRTLLRMKMSGEIDDIIQLYTGEGAQPLHTPDRN